MIDEPTASSEECHSSMDEMVTEAYVSFGSSSSGGSTGGGSMRGFSDSAWIGAALVVRATTAGLEV